ncbi:MAG: ABC transporter permease [Methanomassiliicoccales archaeon]|nr:ABC transporter permease [Methanomassiliicoccales archaeon]
MKTAKLLKSMPAFPSLGVIVAFILLVVVFSLLSDKFFTLSTFAGILTIAAELVPVALAVALLMISGEFDLSVGSVYASAGVLLASLLNKGINDFVAFICVLFFGLIIGSVNSLLTLRLRIPSFIVTLGTMMTIRGIVLVVTGGFPVSFQGKSLLLNILNGPFIYEFRFSALWLLVFLALFMFLLNRTQHGNWSCAAGGNPEVANMLGVKVARVKLINFLLTAMFASIAGMFSFARFGMSYPTLGEGMELEAIASAVLGGCYLSGGFGTILGAFFGALVFSLLRVGLVLAGAPAYWYKAFIGIILVLGMVVNKGVLRRILGMDI